MKKIICFGSPTNCRVFVTSNLCQSVNETSFICSLRKRNNWLRDACVDRPGNTTITMTSTLLRRPWPPSLATGQARGNHRESLHSNQDHLFWVPDQLQNIRRVKILLVSEWDFIHPRLTTKLFVFGSPINCRVFGMSNLC